MKVYWLLKYKKCEFFKECFVICEVWEELGDFFKILWIKINYNIFFLFLEEFKISLRDLNLNKINKFLEW